MECVHTTRSIVRSTRIGYYRGKKRATLDYIQKKKKRRRTVVNVIIKTCNAQILDESAT